MNGNRETEQQQNNGDFLRTRKLCMLTKGRTNLICIEKFIFQSNCKMERNRKRKKCANVPLGILI